MSDLMKQVRNECTELKDSYSKQIETVKQLTELAQQYNDPQVIQIVTQFMNSFVDYGTNISKMYTNLETKKDGEIDEESSEEVPQTQDEAEYDENELNLG